MVAGRHRLLPKSSPQNRPYLRKPETHLSKAIMFQGTGSNVGKSMLVAGFCRALARRGLTVRPFKPQNMSNNAAVTADGGEIGRAQALQARACRAALSVHMNPVLLKPETETGAQVVVQGQRLTTARARDYPKLKPQLLKSVLESFAIMQAQADIVLVEGAGSPAEINLRAGDIANMGFAQAADVPVVLIGDIDRGGVIAQLVGTKAVLDASDSARVRGFLVNKFRGDVSLFDDGLKAIEQHTGWPGFGVVSWFALGHELPAEDAADIRRGSNGGRIKIAVPLISRIANFDDLDPLRLEPEVDLVMVEAGQPIPGDCALVILPGAKSTIGDLAFFRRQGWDIDLLAHVRRGGRVLGICGGYQMMGQSIADPHGIEGQAITVPGLGLLDVETVMSPTKRLVEVVGTDLASGETIQGYEIHIGQTMGPDCDRAWLSIAGEPVGAASPDGLATGCYVHGLFTADAFRRRFLRGLGAVDFAPDFAWRIDQTLDQLADHLEATTDVDAILALAH